MSLYDIAEVQITYHRKPIAVNHPTITKSEEAYRILFDQWDQSKIDLLEQSKILLLDRSLKVLGISELSTGGVAGTIIDPKIVFVTALKANASAIILAHNHPSGNLTASNADNLMTEKLSDAGKLLEITVADHLIIANHGYHSMMDRLSYKKIDSDTGYELEVLMPF